MKEKQRRYKLSSSYKLIKLKKCVCLQETCIFEKLQDILSLIDKIFPNEFYQFVADKVNEIIIGEKTDIGKIEDLHYIKNLRIFNLNKEMYIYKKQGAFHYRIRKDEEIDSKENKIEEAIESFQYERHKKLKIRIRTYIDYNEVGQAGYYDMRFVEIVEDR
jgi:hypothetical protein